MNKLKKISLNVVCHHKYFVNLLYLFVFYSTRKLAQLGRYSEEATRWTAEESGFYSQQGQVIFIFSITSRPTVGLTHSPVQ
jgi:hypothetical protein